MRIVFFRGNFASASSGPNINHYGLICFVHLHPEDILKEDLVSIILKEISSQKKSGEEIVVVPFAHLDKPDRKMSYDSAQNLFKKLEKKMKDVVFIPFRIDNELHLSSVDSFSGFSEF